MAVSRLPDRASARRTGRVLGPRPVLLLAFGAVVVALLGVFTYVVVDSQAQSRREAERRFGAEAKISAELTAAIFTSSTTSGQAAAATAFGGKTVAERGVTALAKRSHLHYALILDGDGKLLAASRGAPAAVRTRANTLSHIRTALSGVASLSDVFPAQNGMGTVIEWALPYPTPFGRRVEVEGFDSRLISGFLSGYLAGTRSDGAEVAYVVDSRGRVLGGSNGAAKPGGRLATPGLPAALASGNPSGTYRVRGIGHYYTSAPVRGSSWRVVVSEPTTRLYPTLAGSRSWILYGVLAAFAAAGAAGLAFLRSALLGGARVTETNRELIAVNASLEQRVAERTAVAEEHARELARSNVELEQFSSVASHDLQEPLRKIRMFGDRLRTGLGEDLPAESASDLERMQNAAERMQRLINDLLDFSRVTHRGKAFERVDLGQVTEEVLSDLEARVVELDARVEVGELPVIEADRTQMRQLLQNLIANALKFRRDDERPVIQIHGEVVAGQKSHLANGAAIGDRCLITVADNGIGFDDKYSDRVFDAFERLHSRSSYEGTGIGLSIARKIVWRHGGDITANAVPERGATFTVTLPLSHANGRPSTDGSPQ